jgi:HK97 family phage portal protein
MSRPETKADDFIPASTEWTDPLPATRYPYGREVGKGLDSNVIMSPVLWIIRNFTEAAPVVQRLTSGEWRDTAEHPLTVRLAEPNAFYDGDQLFKATLISYLLDGNAYWLKVRNVFGAVVELWYLPHFLIEPKWPRDGSEFITHYEYRPFGSQPIELPVRDVVHLRYGLDPRNTRKGYASLKPLVREIYTDDEAANFSASILRNMGVPGGMIAPKGSDALPSAEDVEAMKDYMKSAFTGDRRGEWLVLGQPTETEQFGFDPNRLMLTNLRDIVEERVCAALGIPAAVVGFGAGLQQTKVGATMKELRRLAWVSCIIPHQTTLARQVTRQLMPDFQSQQRRFRLAFDTSGVSAFVEEELERARRVALLVEKGVVMVADGQEMLDLPPDPTQRVYLRPANVVAVKPGEEPEPSPNGGPPDDLSANRLLETQDAAT